MKIAAIILTILAPLLMVAAVKLKRRNNRYKNVPFWFIIGYTLILCAFTIYILTHYL